MKKNLFFPFVLLCTVFVFSFHYITYAAEIIIPEKVSQGRGFLIEIKAQNPFSGYIEWRKKKIQFSSENTPLQNQAKNKQIQQNQYHSQILLGMPTDETKIQNILVSINENNQNNIVKQTIKPLKVNWVTHNLTVAPKYVEPPKEVLNQITKDQKTNKATLARMSNNHTWELPFVRPVNGTISGSFAARRVLNGQPRTPHFGTDMRGAIGTRILAMADGVVVCAEPQYFSGNAIWIDHGQGVISMYGHLSKISVKKGDIIKKGQKIGEVGATGRVTGPHLHLSLYIQGVAVDAVPFFSQMPLEIIGGPTKEQPRPPMPKKKK